MGVKGETGAKLCAQSTDRRTDSLIRLKKSKSKALFRKARQVNKSTRRKKVGEKKWSTTKTRAVRDGLAAAKKKKFGKEKGELQGGEDGGTEKKNLSWKKRSRKAAVKVGKQRRLRNPPHCREQVAK